MTLDCAETLRGCLCALALAWGSACPALEVPYPLTLSQTDSAASECKSEPSRADPVRCGPAHVRTEADAAVDEHCCSEHLLRAGSVLSENDTQLRPAAESETTRQLHF